MSSGNLILGLELEEKTKNEKLKLKDEEELEEKIFDVRTPSRIGVD